MLDHIVGRHPEFRLFADTGQQVFAVFIRDVRNEGAEFSRCSSSRVRLVPEGHVQAELTAGLGMPEFPSPGQGLPDP